MIQDNDFDLLVLKNVEDSGVGLSKEEIQLKIKAVQTEANSLVANAFKENIGHFSEKAFHAAILWSLYEYRPAQELLSSLGYTLRKALQTPKGKMILTQLDIDLSRFLLPQNEDAMAGFEIAMAEIKKGYKKSHWIWYVFPQMRGLGKSEQSIYWGLSGRPEAIAYINHPVLGPRLLEAVQAVLESRYTVSQIFGADAAKVYSCVKLFATVSDSPVFKQLMRKENWH